MTAAQNQGHFRKLLSGGSPQDQVVRDLWRIGGGLGQDFHGLWHGRRHDRRSQAHARAFAGRCASESGRRSAYARLLARGACPWSDACWCHENGGDSGGMQAAVSPWLDPNLGRTAIRRSRLPSGTGPDVEARSRATAGSKVRFSATRVVTKRRTTGTSSVARDCYGDTRLRTSIAAKWRCTTKQRRRPCVSSQTASESTGLLPDRHCVRDARGEDVNMNLVRQPAPRAFCRSGFRFRPDIPRGRSGDS